MQKDLISVDLTSGLECSYRVSLVVKLHFNSLGNLVVITVNCDPACEQVTTRHYHLSESKIAPQLPLEQS